MKEEEKELTNDEYRNLTWKLYSQGDETTFVSFFNNILTTTTKINGFQITGKSLYEKYKEYVEWWQFTYGKKNPEYISKSDTQVCPGDFISKGMYNNSYSIQSNNIQRNLYLFGNNSVDVLLEKLKEFKQYDTEYRQKELPKQRRVNETQDFF